MKTRVSTKPKKKVKPRRKRNKSDDSYVCHTAEDWEWICE